MSAEEHGIGTYPVGLLHDIKTHHLKQGLGWVIGWANAGKWRAVRNYFNGYIAEWHYPPDGVFMAHCGHGWSRRAALRRLGRNLVRDNLSFQELTRKK